MKKIIAVSCILSLCCLLVKAEVKEVKKFSTNVDKLCLLANAFLEYVPKIRKTFNKVENFKINSSNPRNSIRYKLSSFETEKDFKRFYEFLKNLEYQGNLTTAEAMILDLASQEIKSAGNTIIFEIKMLASASSRLKEEYPNYSKRKAASNKLKNIFKKFMKAGGVTLSQKKTKELMASF